MSRLLTAAAYAMHNMPIGTTFNAPVLTDEQAYDVAAYIISQKRPEKANLERDFPIRLPKPIDTPYGPYIDGFSLEQHKYGPFGPIRAKVEELAAASRTANAGEWVGCIRTIEVVNNDAADIRSGIAASGPDRLKKADGQQIPLRRAPGGLADMPRSAEGH
jgi:hypothetical protein